jgi:hypothetical protein
MPRSRAAALSAVGAAALADTHLFDATSGLAAAWKCPRPAIHLPDMTVYFQFPRSPELSRDATL